VETREEGRRRRDVEEGRLPRVQRAERVERSELVRESILNSRACSKRCYELPLPSKAAERSRRCVAHPLGKPYATEQASDEAAHTPPSPPSSWATVKEGNVETGDQAPFQHYPLFGRC